MCLGQCCSVPLHLCPASMLHKCAGTGSEDGGGALWQQQRASLLECFWVGRLIPGTRIETLPFIEVGHARHCQQLTSCAILPGVAAGAACGST